MSPPLQLHFTGKPSRASEWGRCPECVTWYTENRPAILHEFEGFMVEHEPASPRSIDRYMRGRHAEH